MSNRCRYHWPGVAVGLDDPGPRRTAEDALPVVRRLRRRPGRDRRGRGSGPAPGCPGAAASACLEPRVLVGRVVGDDVHDHPQPEGVGVGDQAVACRRACRSADRCPGSRRRRSRRRPAATGRTGSARWRRRRAGGGRAGGSGCRPGRRARRRRRRRSCGRRPGRSRPPATTGCVGRRAQRSSSARRSRLGGGGEAAQHGAGVEGVAAQLVERGVVPRLGRPGADRRGDGVGIGGRADGAGRGVDVALQLGDEARETAAGSASPIASRRRRASERNVVARSSGVEALMAESLRRLPSRCTRTRGSLAAVFDGKFRKPIDQAVKPIGAALRRTRLTPDHLTIAGLVVGVGGGRSPSVPATCSSVCCSSCSPPCPTCSTGRWPRRPARPASGAPSSTRPSTGSPTPCCSAAWPGTWPVNESAHLTLLPFAIMALSSLISYQRAKAESLGLDAKGGLMERAERVVLLCIGLLFEPLLVPVLWLMLALTAITAGPALRQGVAPGAGRPGHGGPHRAAPLPPPEPAGGPQRAAPHPRAPAPHLTVAASRTGAAARSSGSSDAVTVGGFRTGALVARALPSFVAEGLAAADRVRRQLRQRRAAGDDRAPPAARQPDVDGLARCARPCRSPSTPTPATGSRACACRRCRRRTVAAGFDVDGFSHITAALDGGHAGRSSPCRTSAAGSGPGAGSAIRVTA